MNRSLLFLPLFLLFAALEVHSVPSNPKIHKISLSDGRKIDVRKVGDENFHFYQADDGMCYIKGTDGTYTVFNPQTVYDLQPARRCSIKNTSSYVYKSFPIVGSQKSLVILVEFSDLSFAVDSPENAFSKLFNEEGYSDNDATGSVRDYFLENSNGIFSVEFDVVGPVKLDKPMKYYGENDTSSPYQNKDIRAQEVVVDACKAVDGEVDFSQYDYDNDGRVDNVFVVYSGYSEADGGSDDCIWPHEWNLVDAGFNLTLDGKQIYSYACSNELKDGTGTSIVGIGTFCHEFGHVLGLPDLYTTNSSNSFTPGPWSVMDVGSYNNEGRTPPYLSSYEKMVLGWITPDLLPVGEDNVLLSPIESNKAFLLKTDDPDEYFLFENRQLNGWDAFLPGHGMLVWHIDYDKSIWDISAVNNDYMHQHVDILEADNSLTSYTRAGDTFPGTNNITELNDNTVPGLVSWSEKPSYVDIYSISEVDGNITFSTQKSISDIEAPIMKSATDITPTSFVARWNKSVGAIEYEINVVEKYSGNVVSGYNWKNVGDVDSAYVVMLTPATEYVCSLRARNGIYCSDESEPIVVTTPDYTFEFLSPSVLPAEKVTNNSFTACWNEMEDAVSYFINVYSEVESGELYKENGFSNNLIMPTGWKTSCTRTNGIDGYYGKAAPALRFDKDGQYLSTPSAADYCRSLCFWYRASSVDDSNSLTIEGQKCGEWIELDKISPLSDAEGGQTFSIKEMPDSITMLRLVYNGTRGSLMIDDVVVGTAKYDLEVMNGYSDIDAGNGTSYLVSGLEKGKEYQYAVRAFNGEVYSMWSDRISVKTSTSINNNIKLSKTDELKVCNVNSGALFVNLSDTLMSCSVIDISGITVLDFDIEPHEEFWLNAFPGIYIVRYNDSVKKIIIK